MAKGRFRFPETIKEEEHCVERAVPKSTRYQKRWAVGIFEDWQRVRNVLWRVWIGQSSATYSAHNRDGRIDAQLLVVHICSRGGRVFQRSIPFKTVYQIVCGIRRFMVEKNPAVQFNLLDSSDKRCVNGHYWRGGPFDILKLKEIALNFSLFLIRFAIFRRILDAEMKGWTRTGVGLKVKQKEKKPVSF